MCCKLVLAALSALLALVTAEAGVHLWLTRIASDAQFVRYASMNQLIGRHLDDPGAGFLITPHRHLGYQHSPDYAKGLNRHNSLGLRGPEVTVPKPAGELRIVCVGGSTTYTSCVDDWRLAYPALLETFLREAGHGEVTVVNAGGDGWTTLESLINFETRMLDLEPDLVVVYHAANDLNARLVWPPEAYAGDYSGSRQPLQRSASSPPPWEASDAVRAILVSRGVIEPHSSYVRTVDREPPTFFAFKFWDQFARGAYPSGPFREVGVDRMLAENPPIYFERNLEALVATAARAGARTVLATFVCSEAFPDQVCAQPDYARGLAEMNASLGAVAGRSGAVLFDFAARFPADRALFVDQVHLNEDGARVKARLFADFLLESGLLD